MAVYLYLDSTGLLEGWGTNHAEGTVEVDLELSDPILTKLGIARFKDGILKEDPNIPLENAKRAKDKELNEKCSDAILAGFEHIVDGVSYWFSYDIEAQGNFRDGKDALEDGLITHIPWTVRVGGIDGEHTRILIDLAIMNELTVARLQHATGKIGKYRDFLMPMVLGATTIEEVDSVVW